MALWSTRCRAFATIFCCWTDGAWFDFNWLDLVVSARKDGAVAAVGLREIARPITATRSSSTAAALSQSIRAGQIARALADGGVYYLTRQAVEDSAAPTSPERGILPLIARGALRGYRYSGFFIDIDVPRISPRRRKACRIAAAVLPSS